MPLEALPVRSSPSAIVSRGRVVCADRAALEAGVVGGQKLSTALGLQPGLAVFERNPAAEARALETLACWAGSLTPTVALQPPDALLLEIGGCLRLFGGAEAIAAAAQAGCAAQHYAPGWAVAPTPLAALWLARAGGGALLPDAGAMRAALAELPCAVPGWSADTLARLDAFGLRRLGDLRGLAGAGLRRRLGNDAVDDLARAWGDLPDPRQAFVFPESFRRQIELPARIEHAEALAFVGQRLFLALAGWLQARQLLLRACTLLLKHDDGAVSRLPLRFAEPAADEARFARLLREHLGRWQLAGPVEAVTLAADDVVPRPGASQSLFARAAAGEGAQACLERLQARLGPASVHVLAARPDYRPECATLAVDPVAAAPVPAAVAAPDAGGPLRPLWLLPRPQALAERPDGPQWHGPLKLLSRAERLESGWWDEGETEAAGDVRRDYFVACNRYGQWAWVFRDAEGWFLHGLFS